MSNEALAPELTAGYARFRDTRYAAQRDRYRQLAAEGQRPRTLIVACSDSRAAPEIVFDARPGELFVVRNVAALVPAYEPDTRSHAASAALEYGVLGLGVDSIVVMGHGRCGGVAAAFDDAAPLSHTDFIGTWVAGLRRLALEQGRHRPGEPEANRRLVELRSVEQSLRNLQTFPWIRARVRDGSLALSGCWFDIALGELHALEDGAWKPIPSP